MFADSFNVFDQLIQIMQNWAQLCNLRSSLLHLQFLYCFLSQKIQQQKSSVSRAHKDRLMQYSSLWQEYINSENINFKRLVIIKLQACLSCYENDSKVWELMDLFSNYCSAVERDLMDNISKLYLGKKVMLDISAVQEELKKIEEKIVSFLRNHTATIEEYGKRMQTIAETRNIFSSYLGKIKQFYSEVSSRYPAHVTRRLQCRMKQLDKEVEDLKAFLLK